MLQIPVFTQQNPYEFDYFPYGYDRYSIIQYWVETRQMCGQRIAHRTYNPYQSEWNGVKHSTYSDLVLFSINPKSFLLEKTQINFCDISNQQLAILIQEYHLSEDQQTIVLRYVNLQRAEMLKYQYKWLDPLKASAVTQQQPILVPDLILEPGKYPKNTQPAPEKKYRNRTKGKDNGPELTPEQQAVYDSLLKKM